MHGLHRRCHSVNFGLVIDGTGEADRPTDRKDSKKFITPCVGVPTQSIHPSRCLRRLPHGGSGRAGRPYGVPDRPCRVQLYLRHWAGGCGLLLHSFRGALLQAAWRAGFPPSGPSSRGGAGTQMARPFFKFVGTVADGFADHFGKLLSDFAHAAFDGPQRCGHRSVGRPVRRPAC